MRVIVGSKNPVKINAARLAFENVWPDQEFEVDGIDVPSNVSDQPMTDLETYTGAKNRAVNVLNEKDTDYAVGLEGGLQKFEGEWYCTGWVVVMNKEGEMGSGTSIRIKIPQKMIDIVSDGKTDLGAATDTLFDRINVKQQEGLFGILTNNALTRTTAFRDGIVAALAYFNAKEMYKAAPQTKQDELIDIVDEVNNVLYAGSKFEAHEKGLLHRTVIGELRTSDGRICLVRQTPDRQDAGQFVTPIGGHVQSGETEEEALIREAQEEIGVSDIKYKLLGRKIYNREVLGRKENHYYVVFQVIYDGELKLGSEADAFEYFTLEQLKIEMEYNPAKFGDSFKFVYQNFNMDED